MATAQTVMIDSISYELSAESLQAEVVYRNPKYAGDVVIPSSVIYEGIEYCVTSIRKQAFYCCTSLTSITIPASVTSIGVEAFRRCPSLTAINIPESVTSIGKSAFYDCSGELTVNCNIPAASSYVAGVFYGSNFTKVIFGERVKSIGGYAFYGCSSLTSITLPKGLTSIGVAAFSGCSSLTSINIPEGLTSIGGSAFGGTAWYNNLPDGLVYIGKVLYEYKGTMPENTSIEIKEGIVSISPSAFYSCSSLTSINIPESVTSIGSSAFYNCRSLTTITLPESLKSIGEMAFDHCTSLTTIYIPKSVTSIGECAFRYCSSLTSITLPESLTSIGDDAFRDCSRLTAINIPENSQLTSIGKSTFERCTRLTAINIPESVTSIGGSAFYGCSSLKELILGKGLKKIAVDAFSTCRALEKITIHATQPPRIEGEGNALFSDATYENATLYVPQGSISKYQVMTGWSGFYNMSEIKGGTPDYLTLRQADNGEIRIAVDLGRTYQMQIVPSTGWKIHTVTFDGKDMTAQLAADNTFTTPTINGSAVLNVAYVKEGSAIAAATASRIKVQGHQGIISIAGATEGEAIGLYTTSGTLVATATAEGDTTHLTVPTGQVYIVTVGDAVVKIGM